MNLYHCMIEIKDGAHALAFAAATSAWMDYLKARNLIANWRLLRRKFRLASGAHSDFILEVEISGLAELDALFSAVSAIDEAGLQAYEKMHFMIASVDVGLYRPFPDPAQRERIALV
jgi:hypothetical protein